MMVEGIGRYDPYKDKFIKNSTTDRIEVGTDGNLYRLSVSNGNEFLSKDRLYTKVDIVALLDKVRAEIDKIYEREGHSFDCLNALDDLKEFIDKLQAESEE